MWGTHGGRRCWADDCWAHAVLALLETGTQLVLCLPRPTFGAERVEETQSRRRALLPGRVRERPVAGDARPHGVKLLRRPRAVHCRHPLARKRHRTVTEEVSATRCVHVPHARSPLPLVPTRPLRRLGRRCRLGCARVWIRLIVLGVLCVVRLVDRLDDLLKRFLPDPHGPHPQRIEAAGCRQASQPQSDERSYPTTAHRSGPHNDQPRDRAAAHDPCGGPLYRALQRGRS
jgi:hypothetical protein